MSYSCRKTKSIFYSGTTMNSFAILDYSWLNLKSYQYNMYYESKQLKPFHYNQPIKTKIRN